MRVVGCVLSLVLSLRSCGSGDSQSDPDASVVEPDGGDTCEGFDPLPPGDPVGSESPLDVPPGEARAGIAELGDLPADPEGLAVWGPGDYLLVNERVAFIIEAAGRSQLYDPYGGKIVGMALNDDGTLVSPADYMESAIAMGRYIVDPTSVGVVNDGSDGESAIIRVIGTLNIVPFIDLFAQLFAPANYLGREVIVEYELAPDTDYVDIHYTFINETDQPSTIAQVLYLVFTTNRMPAFGPGTGFGVGSGTFPWLGFIDHDAASYAIEDTRDNLSYLITVAGATVVQSDGLTTPACSIERHHVSRLFLGGPGVDGLITARAASEGDDLRTIEGVVYESDGSTGAAGIHVHATTDDDEYLTRVSTDGAGEFALHVPSDAAVKLYAYRRGNVPVGPIAIAANETAATLTFAATGTIHVETDDFDTGDPLPARIQVIPASTVPEMPGTFGEPGVIGAGRLHVVFPADGIADLRVPPGEHRIVVSRGPEYDVVDQNVEVTADSTTNVSALLDHVVDTNDVLCGDTHMHTNRSPDAEDPSERMLRSAIADGLELPFRTDHEWVNGFEETIADLGVEEWAFGITSTELTTFTWGHMNVFPLVQDLSQPNDGFIEWYGRNAPDLFPEILAKDSEPAIIINHPRSSGVNGGYFEVAGYDPVTGTAENPEYYSDQFQFIEVTNASTFDANRAGPVADWFSFLDAGRRIFAVGSSDSHGVMGGPTGYPRTCIDLRDVCEDRAAPCDDPVIEPARARELGADAVRDAALTGAITVSGGIYVTAVADDGSSHGDTQAEASANETIQITVQRPEWVSFEQLEVIVNGSSTIIDAEDADTDNGVTATFQVVLAIPEGSSWVIAHASGAGTLEPVFPGNAPFGFTNPIFFER